MIDVKKYNITQQELNEYIATIVIPRYTIEIEPINDYFDLLIKLEDGTKISQGYYGYQNIDTSDTGIQFEDKFIEKLCMDKFKDKLIIPIDLNTNSTRGDIKDITELITENTIETQYLTSLIELGL